MKAVSDSLLRAKHWQIFLVMLSFVGAAITVMLRSFVVTPPGKFPSSVPFFVVMELFAISFGLWLWSLGMFLNSFVPQPKRMKMTFFRFSIIYVPLYLAIFDIFFEGQNLTRNISIILISWAVIFPMHFFAMFCQIYTWYFVSKTLAVAESGRIATFPDYIGYFFGLWILPIGIWIIQPRINRLYAAT